MYWACMLDVKCLTEIDLINFHIFFHMQFWKNLSLSCVFSFLLDSMSAESSMRSGGSDRWSLNPHPDNKVCISTSFVFFYW